MSIYRILCFLAFTLPFQLTAVADSNRNFEQLLAEHWAQAKQEKVFFRTDPDGFRMNGKLPEFNQKARQRRQAYNQSLITRLKSIDISKLNEANRVSYKLFDYERHAEAKSYQQPGHLFPINKLFGYHTYFADAPANMSFLTLDDYQKYLVSLADFPRYNQEQIALLREAIDKGFVHYCESMQGYEKSISQHIVKSPLDSQLYGPFKAYPRQILLNAQMALSAKGAKLIEEKVIPQYQALYDFYTKEYIPNCRQKPGIQSVQGGADYYQAEIEFFTTTKMTPKQIHELGLSEVKRIKQEMGQIMQVVGFKGDFKAFLEYLREEPKFYAKTEQELLARTALIAKNIEGELPKYFSLLPRGTYKIKPGTRGAFYMASTGDGKTSGTYFIGTQDLKSQPLYTLEALTLHEGVPGHHLQSAVALELDVPEFRKTLYHSAYGEGWGLYSERLGKEMGFYQDPYSDFGRLTYEMFRAVRLVVDTGIHAYGWSRGKAIDYMLANSALSRNAVASQIDRYITWPAQALSYKIGELKIRALRAKAEKALKSRFDLRAFHDTVIGNGSLPIDVLEELIGDWILTQKK